MDCEDQVKKEGKQSNKVSEEKYFIDLKAMEVCSPATLASKGTLEPITPNPNRENGDFVPHHFPQDLLTSPSTAASNPDGGEGTSPRTPSEVIFDPFAPGPEKLICAPFCGNRSKRLRININRKLDFESSVNFIEESILDEQALLEAVYISFLQFILSQNPDADADHCFGTPISAPRLSGNGETCPAVPIKQPARKSRNIDPTLCRKLEF